MQSIWTWDWPLFLTIAGWGKTIKSAAYLLIPQLADRMLEKKMATTPRGYQIVGDRLILKPIGTTTEVSWERIK